MDLVPLRHYLRYEFHPPRRVAVIGPAGLASRLDALHDQAGFAAVSLDVTDHQPGPVGIGSLTIEAIPVQHTADSHAIRVAAGQRPGLVYSGDCGRADDLRPLIRPGDTLLAEATYGADPVAPGSNHLNAIDVGRVAADTGVGRVLLTHVLMGRDRAKAVAAAAALVAVPVDVVDSGRPLRALMTPRSDRLDMKRPGWSVHPGLYPFASGQLAQRGERFRSPGRRIRLRTAIPARARRMTLQPSLDPEEPGSELVEGGVTSGVPVSPARRHRAPSVVVVPLVEVVSDTSEVSVVVGRLRRGGLRDLGGLGRYWVEVVSDTSEVSVDVVCVDDVDVVDVCEQPHLGELNAAAAVPGMSSAAPSSVTAPSQPRRRSRTVRKWCPPVIRSLISLSPRKELMIASRE